MVIALKVQDLLAFITCYASHLACSSCRSSLIAVGTGHINFPVFFCFFAKFYQIPRTSFYTGTTRNAFFIGNYRQTGSIDPYAEHQMHMLFRSPHFQDIHNCNQSHLYRGCWLSGNRKPRYNLKCAGLDSGVPLHFSTATVGSTAGATLPSIFAASSITASPSDRTIKTIKGIGLYKGFSHVPASGKTTSTTIGSRQCCLDFINPGIFKYLEFLSNKVEDNSRNKREQTQTNYSYQNRGTH